MKNWQISIPGQVPESELNLRDIKKILLENRGFSTPAEIKNFIDPPDPILLKPEDVGIDPVGFEKAVRRIIQAIENHESIVVYADYDADGITAGAVMWENLHQLGAKVMPYIPHRIDEGYGLSIKGIDAVIDQHQPTLIITVDHGITAAEKVVYARSKNIEVIVTDHHVIPEREPDCTTVHTTQMSGAGISWFVAKEITIRLGKIISPESLALAAIGTIADMVPLTRANRSIAKYGLQAINNTTRIGLLELMKDAGIIPGEVDTYTISHILAPRLNAMGRIVHAMDALRLICTKNQDKARELAEILGLTNKERQQMTLDSTLHAKDLLKNKIFKRLIFISDASYNPGVIGLVAGKLTEEYYLPSVVVSIGEEYSKASARSIAGFNIVEAIRSKNDLLVDVGGHPMAAGFTVLTSKLVQLETELNLLAEKLITDVMLVRSLKIDVQIPFRLIDTGLWEMISELKPFGFGNTEPVFATKNVTIVDSKLVGSEGKHVKLKLSQKSDAVIIFDAIAFGMGKDIANLRPGTVVDVAYTVDMNYWNGRSKLQLKVKDILFASD